MLTDAQWAMLEPLVEQCRPRGKPHRWICAGHSRRSSGAMRTVPSGGPSPLNLVRGGGRLRPSSAGLGWVSGSACSTWCRSAGSSSA